MVAVFEDHGREARGRRGHLLQAREAGAPRHARPIYAARCEGAPHRGTTGRGEVPGGQVPAPRPHGRAKGARVEGLHVRQAGLHRRVLAPRLREERGWGEAT